MLLLIGRIRVDIKIFDCLRQRLGGHGSFTVHHEALKYFANGLPLPSVGLADLVKGR